MLYKSRQQLPMCGFLNFGDGVVVGVGASVTEISKQNFKQFHLFLIITQLTELEWPDPL